MTISRRTFLGALAVPLLPGFASAQTLGGQEARFASILHQIAGIPDLSPLLIRAAESELAETYGAQARSGLVRALGTGALADRLALADAGVQEQVRFLARLLYTGEVTRDGVTKAIYYPWCVAWRSLTFATAPGLCSGPAFGHWAEAPGTEARL